tara:strand:+ start:85 stop:300 length:216 start_codon:yes stop_codon:yes gene_type:complete
MKLNIQIMQGEQVVGLALEENCQELVINGFTVIRNGQICYEEYQQLFNGNTNQALGNNQPNNLLPIRDDVN